VYAQNVAVLDILAWVQYGVAHCSSLVVVNGNMLRGVRPILFLSERARSSFYASHMVLNTFPTFHPV
jgi:hypothetical protein